MCQMLLAEDTLNLSTNSFSRFLLLCFRSVKLRFARAKRMNVY